MASQANIEISGASSDFEGVWGGYMRGIEYSPFGHPIRRMAPVPERVSFLLRDGIIVLSFTTMGDPAWTASGRKAWASTAGDIVLREEFDSFSEHQVELTRYKLKGSTIIQTEEITIYNSHSKELLGSQRTR